MGTHLHKPFRSDKKCTTGNNNKKEMSLNPISPLTQIQNSKQKSQNSPHILTTNCNYSPYILTLVKKGKQRVYKAHAFINVAILCRDSASSFI